MEATRRIFLTGANRGLGKELVQILADKHPQLQLHLSSRSPPAQLSEIFPNIPPASIHSYQIDLNSHESIQTTAQELHSKGIRFDYIVANAAVGCDYGTQIPSL